MNLLGFLVPPWAKWAGLAAIVLLLMGAGWKVNGWRHRAAEADAAERALADYRAAVTKRDTEHSRDLSATQKREADLARALTAVADMFAQTKAAIPNLPLVTHHDAPPNAVGRCDVPVRSPVYRVCYNAATTGDAAALAACAAYASDGTGRGAMPAAGLVRPRQP